MKKAFVTLTDYVINIKSTVLSVTCNQYEIKSSLSHNFLLQGLKDFLFYFFSLSLRGVVPLQSYELPSKTVPESSSQVLIPVEDHIASVIHTCSHLVFLWNTHRFIYTECICFTHLCEVGLDLSTVHW